MRFRRLAALSVLTSATAFVVAPATASGERAPCPDDYTLIATIFLPEDQQDKDKNGNFLACAKGPQGSNGHFNVKDDKTIEVIDVVDDI